MYSILSHLISNKMKSLDTRNGLTAIDAGKVSCEQHCKRFNTWLTLRVYRISMKILFGVRFMMYWPTLTLIPSWSYSFYPEIFPTFRTLSGAEGHFPLVPNFRKAIGMTNEHSDSTISALFPVQMGMVAIVKDYYKFRHPESMWRVLYVNELVCLGIPLNFNNIFVFLAMHRAVSLYDQYVVIRVPLCISFCL